MTMKNKESFNDLYIENSRIGRLLHDRNQIKM